MIRSSRQRRLYLLSGGFAVLPPLVAIIRAFSANYDLRMLWMAFASFVGAALVMWIGGARKRPPKGVIALAGAALVAGTALAGLTAMWLGATAPFGIWAVAFVLSACWAVSHALNTLSRLNEA
jgi:hypothetical protein